MARSYPRGELSFATSSGGGIDLREIPAATIERVEVIRGVPSARYGDFTQGTILVDTRAGVYEPEVRAQYDANTSSVQAPPRRPRAAGGPAWSPLR